MTEKSEKLEEVLNKIQEKDVRLVRFEMSDMYGISHMRGVPARHFESSSESGVAFAQAFLAFDPQGNIAKGTGLTTEIGYADADFYPDLDSFQLIPWQNRTARVLLSPSFQGVYLDFYPRNIALRQLVELKKLGYSLFSAHEYEFFVVDEVTQKPVTSGVQIRSTVRMGEKQDFLDQIRDQLPIAGVDLEGMDTEYAPGQYEITYKPEFGIRSADNALTYKTGIKEIARQHKLVASFMSKPYNDESGSGGHFNHSLWNADGTKSIMYDHNSPTKLSKVAEHWLAGILHHAPAITVLLAQTCNCYSRLVNFSFAPTSATWGMDNRTVLARVKVNGNKTRFENRLVSAASCPYISLAAVVAAGIDGIKKKMELPPRVCGSAYFEENLPADTVRLPSNLKDAVDNFLANDVIKNAFGEKFVKCFTACKRHEQQVHDEALACGKDEFEWAREYYFEYS